MRSGPRDILPTNDCETSAGAPLIILLPSPVYSFHRLTNN